MKIAIFHELPRGGARRAINSFAAELTKTNLVDLYIVEDKEVIKERKNFRKVYFYRFVPEEWKGKNWKARLYKDTIELFKIYKLHRNIARIIDAKKYDVVLVSASRFIEAPFIMRFLKTPFAYYIHDPFYRIVYEEVGMPKNVDFFRYNYEKVNRYIRGVLDRQNVHFAKLCLSPSRFIAEKFSRIYKKENSVIYYGVDSKFFSPSNTKKEYDIFYIGSHDYIDGYDLVEKAIQTMHRKPKIRSIFVEEEWISEDTALRDLYRKSKIFLAPARNEGLGASLMEAMACGIPVIAVSEAGHKELVIDGKTGYLIPRDAKKLAQLLEEILPNSEKLMELGKNARKYMETEWLWKKRANELEKVLEKL